MTCNIKLFSRGKKSIPIYFSRGAFQTTNVRLPDVVFTNEYDHPVSIERVDIRCFFGDTELAVYRVPLDQLDGVSKRSTAFIQELGQTVVGRFRIGLIYGELTTGPEELSMTPLAYCSVLLPISEVVFVEYTGFNQVDSILIEVWYDNNGNLESVGLPVSMTAYRCRGQYVFPLRSGSHLYFTDNPVVSITSHRTCRSQEFAIDMVIARQGQDGRLATKREHASTSVRDYLIFGKEVLAIGDGVVSMVSNFYPDALLDTIGEDYDVRKEQAWDEMSVRIGGQVAVSGNHVVIDHENGEFSEYDHLSENSITVKVGERVRQGQVIGRVGNTGYSSVPHLHLQLTDGPEKTRSNGLPVIFQNVDVMKINNEVGDNCNTLMFSPYLYFTLGKR